MPAARAGDSYRIYSSFAHLGEKDKPLTSGDVWWVADTTVSPVRTNEPCDPGPYQEQTSRQLMNPHRGISVPKRDQQDFAEILEDWDMHCHERVKLDAAAWRLDVPLRLVSSSEKQEAAAQSFHSSKPTAFISSFSQVYFNLMHTVALVYARRETFVGFGNAEGHWFPFALQNGAWKPLKWSTYQEFEN